MRSQHGAGWPRARDELEWPFCGDEYPPLKGFPGPVVCTKPQHPVTEIHLSEETGWVWPSGRDAWLLSRPDGAEGRGGTSARSRYLRSGCAAADGACCSRGISRVKGGNRMTAI